MLERYKTGERLAWERFRIKSHMIDYQKDFYGWTQEQAALLKAGRFDRLDVSNLTEELEAVRRAEKRELEHRLALLLIPLLKWRYQPSRHGNSERRLTIEEQRTANATGLDKDFPSVCPWSLAEILNDDYWPD
jgi:hypothetical protein